MKGQKQLLQQRLLVEGGQHRGRGWDNAQPVSWLSLDLPVSMTGDSRTTGLLAQKKWEGNGEGEQRGKQTNKQKASTNSTNSLWRKTNLLIVEIQVN